MGRQDFSMTSTLASCSASGSMVPGFKRMAPFAKTAPTPKGSPEIATLRKDEISRAVTGTIPKCVANTPISVWVLGQIHEEGEEPTSSWCFQVAGRELLFRIRPIKVPSKSVAIQDVFTILRGT